MSFSARTIDTSDSESLESVRTMSTPDERIQELEQQLADLKAAKTSLAEQLVQAQKTSTQAPVHASAPAPRPARPRIDAPTAFDGDRAKGKQFLRQAYVYMAANPDDYASESAKIFCVLSYMKTGNAAIWAGQVIDKFMTADQQQAAAPYPTYREFVLAFTERFVSSNEKEHAANAIETILQGTRSADDYIAEFNQYADASGHNDWTLARCFRKGLKPALLSKLYEMRPMPEKLKEQQEAVAEMDHQHEEQLTFRALGRASTTSQPRPAAPRSAPALVVPAPVITRAPAPVLPARQPDVVPMDLDRGNSRFRADAKARGACYACGQAGHRRGDPVCPNVVRLVETAVQAAIRSLASASAPLGEVTPPAVAPARVQTPAPDQVFDEAHE